MYLFKQPRVVIFRSHTDMAIYEGDIQLGWVQLAQSGSRSAAKVSSFPQVFIL